MKKLLSLILVFLFLNSVSAVSAAETVVGNIYSTDILAYVNGKQIDSYNIGGKTAIFVEDLYDWEHNERSYGFTWSYNDEKRMLTVSSDGRKGFGSYDAPRGQTGTMLGNVYATDIQVYFNGHEVPGYNIGGRTAVCIEDLGTVDETSQNFQFGYSNYLCNFKWDEANRTVSLETYLQDDFDWLNHFPNYKLKFFLKDDQLSCTFDQLNPYQCTLETEFSENFLRDAYRIKPVYMNGEYAGNLVLDGEGGFVAQFQFHTLYKHTKDLAEMLTYEEAKQYVSDNFEVLDTREDENAVTYLAKQGEVRYLLHAMKRGGLVQDGIFHSGYTTVELGEVTNPENSDFGQPYVYLYPFGGPHGATSCKLMYATDQFDFAISYNSFQDMALSQYSSICSTIGVADLIIDGKHYKIDAIEAYEYKSNIFVDVDQIVEILGIEYRFQNGNFVFETNDEKHEISISLDTVKYHEPVYKEIYNMITGDILLNGEKTAFTYLAGGSLLTNGASYEKEVQPYLYDGKAYVPFHFFELIYS